MHEQNDIQNIIDGFFANRRAEFGHNQFFMELGAGGDGGSGGDGAPAGGDQAPAAPATPATSATPQVEEISSLPEWAQARMKSLSDEAANASSKARETAREQAANEARQAVLDEFGKALGFIKDDGTADAPKVEELTSTITEREAQIRTLTARNAVLEHGTALGANVSALLDRVGFNNTLAGLDPTAATFEADIKSAITKALEADTTLRAARVVTAGGTQLPGSGETKPKSGGLTGSIAAHYGA